MNWSYIVASAIGAIPGIIAAYHARMAKRTAQSVNVKVNGNLDRLVDIISKAAVEIPHDVAAKVVSAAQTDIPPDATTDQKVVAELSAKLGNHDQSG